MTITGTSSRTRQRDAALDDLRAQFPILARQVNGRPLVYLDNAATTQKPQPVIDAVSRFYRESNGNVRRSVHVLSAEATAAYEAARDTVRAFVNAPEPEGVVFVHGTTEGINLVAQAYARPRLKPGDRVLITAMEHHANLVPWQVVCRQAGATLDVAPITDRGEIDLDALSGLLAEQTQIVALPHASNVLGTVNPVRQVVDLAKKVGAVVVVDGAQAPAHLEVDVRALGCDFYAFSGHKMFGPTGIGVLWGRLDLLESMEPYGTGGEMVERVTFEHTTFAPPPSRFEPGTPHIAGAIGLAEAVRFIEGLDRAAVQTREHALLEDATRRLEEIPGVRLIGTAAHKLAIVSFMVEGAHPHDLATILDGEGVAVRAGHHCAQPLMDRFGVVATVRASFCAYNMPEEVDALIGAVQRAREMFAP